MPKLFLICGLPGSGKTTLARRLANEGRALRLTPDEWIVGLLGDDFNQAELDRLRDPVEALQWDVAAQAMKSGIDVILDWGFWSRKERDDYRSRGEALGATVEVRFLDVPRDELAMRLAKRNAEPPPGVFNVSEAQLDLWLSSFEPPTEDETSP